jgi:hypothetical protein
MPPDSASRRARGAARGTIDQDREALYGKFVGAGRLPAICASAALNLVRAADLGDLACTPAR